VTLRIVLFGTGDFAVTPFRALIESAHDVAAVYTQPDRTGRGHHRHVNPAKVLAEEHGIPVRQPVKVNAADVLEELRSFQADVFIVAAYGQILKPAFLAIPPLGAFNLHGSLLPKHRGAAPVQYSIWKGDREGGVTIFQIEPALDSGPMVGKVATPIGPKETSGELMQRLAELSGPLLLDVVDQLAAGTATFEVQDADCVTLAPKIPKEAGVIDWSQSAENIGWHVRAMQPWPKASTTLQSGDASLRCIVLDIDISKETQPRNASPGEIRIADKRMFVATGSGMLEILKLQPQGKQAMTAAAFLNGYQLALDARFGT